MKTNLAYIPVNENNLVYRAADLLMKEFQISDGLEINLKKVIPVAAGMARRKFRCGSGINWR